MIKHFKCILEFVTVFPPYLYISKGTTERVCV